MRILIYKRTHKGDPNYERQFGVHGCIGRIRGFAFDAVIGVGGVSRQPKKEGISGKINWVGRYPKKSQNPADSRGPLVSFGKKDFRIFEEKGPFLSTVAPHLAKRIYKSGARFIYLSLSHVEQKEAQQLLKRILDSGEFDHLQFKKSALDRCINKYQRLMSKHNC
jgi:hypothetical protein